MLDVATAQDGLGLGPWTRISGLSEQVMAWIQARGPVNAALTSTV